MNWWPKKNVIVPVDFSDESFAAVDTAMELVTNPGHICVLHALEDPYTYEYGEGFRPASDESREHHTRQALRERLSDAKYEELRIEVIHDDPPHGIAEFAQQTKADLIIMPSHGRTGLKRLLIGSVAERVVRLAHCPVLVLRT